MIHFLLIKQRMVIYMLGAVRLVVTPSYYNYVMFSDGMHVLHVCHTSSVFYMFLMCIDAQSCLYKLSIRKSDGGGDILPTSMIFSHSITCRYALIFLYHLEFLRFLPFTSCSNFFSNVFVFHNFPPPPPPILITFLVIHPSGYYPYHNRVLIVF